MLDDNKVTSQWLGKSSCWILVKQASCTRGHSWATCHI